MIQRTFCITFIGLMVSTIVRADVLVFNKNLTYSDVQVTSVKDGQITFMTQAGREVQKPLAQATKIQLADEPAFNSAEEAFAAREWDKAAAGYEKTVKATQKPWLQEWSSVRLLESANKAGRFDAAVNAYIGIAEKAPESLKSVAMNMPKANSAYLTEAANLLNAAIAKAKSESTRAALLKLLVDVNNAKGDLKASEAALEKLANVNATINPNSAEAQQARTALKVKGLRTAIAAKEYDKVLQAIEKDASVFTEPADQAEALLCLADAQAGKLGESKEVEAWKEVAVSYVRVVVSAPGSSHAGAALLRVAAIHETKLGEKDTAIKLYQQIMADFKGQDTATQAQQEMKRLGV